MLNLKPSYYLAVILVVAGLAACAIVVRVPMPVSLKFLIGVPMVLGTAYFIAQDALILLPWSFTHLMLNTKGELIAVRKDGTKKVAQVLPSSFVAAYLTVLNFKTSGSRWEKSLLLTPDRVGAEAFRQLRVWLRWGKSAENQNKTSAVSDDSTLF